MHLGSGNFQVYSRNLSRIYWADFIDEQQRKLDERLVMERASLVRRMRELRDLSLAVAASKGIEV